MFMCRPVVRLCARAVLQDGIPTEQAKIKGSGGMH